VSGSGASACTQCRSGTYSNADKTSCVQCPTGTFSYDGATSCFTTTI
jgi:hypothetical protein